jgi:hypothetical protein
MFVHGPVEDVPLCHWIVQVPVPFDGVAVKVTVPPTQTVDEEGVMLMPGPGVTTTVATLEAAASQPLPVQV